MELNKSQYKVNTYYGNADFTECMKNVIIKVNSKEVCKIELSKNKAVSRRKSSRTEDELRV